MGTSLEVDEDVTKALVTLRFKEEGSKMEGVI